VGVGVEEALTAGGGLRGGGFFVCSRVLAAPVERSSSVAAGGEGPSQQAGTASRRLQGWCYFLTGMLKHKYRIPFNHL
jgi:hypothetical protein